MATAKKTVKKKEISTYDVGYRNLGGQKPYYEVVNHKTGTRKRFSSHSEALVYRNRMTARAKKAK